MSSGTLYRGLRHSPLSVALIAAALFACRDTAEPFRPADREPPPDVSLLRLTYGFGDDRGPVWSAGGDSIYYTTSRYDANPSAPATVLAVAADGMGPVAPLLRNVQEGVGSTNWIAAPALSAAGTEIAFVRVPPLLPDRACVGVRVCPVMAGLPTVRLVHAELHVRALDWSGGLADDLVLPLRFAGHSLQDDPSVRGGVMTVSEYHPFQFQFETSGRAIFRPSWNPDGTQLVVSDGLRLLSWRPGAAAAVEIAGTADGMMPAWSPDGAWIAYARYARVGSETFLCEYLNGGIVDCVERRIIHHADDPMIVLVRPDGSEERVLGQGTDPAWSPDGTHVYASTGVGEGDMIVRLPLDGGPAVPIPNTQRGIEPAVSPDGRRLAFARTIPLAKPATHDLWVVELP